jgi:hypothetical protein
MNRFLMIISALFFLLGTQISWAAQPVQQTQPAKKTVAPPASKPVSRAPAAVAAARPAAAPVARVASAPAVASPAALQAVATSGAARSPASVMGAGSGNGNSKDISEELKIMGQSRNLSMGLLFQKDKDKLTFGTPRTNYEDKVSDKKANF